MRKLTFALSLIFLVPSTPPLIAAEPEVPKNAKAVSQTLQSNRYKIPGTSIDVTPTGMRYLQNVGHDGQTVINLALVQGGRNGDKTLLLSFPVDDDSVVYITPVNTYYREMSDLPTQSADSEGVRLLKAIKAEFDSPSLVILKANGEVDGNTNSNSDAQVVLDVLSKLRIARGFNAGATPIALRLRIQESEVVSSIMKIARSYFAEPCDKDVAEIKKPENAR